MRFDKLNLKSKFDYVKGEKENQIATTEEKIEKKDIYDLKELHLPEKIKSKGRPKVKGPAVFKPKILIDSSLSKKELERKLLQPINGNNEEFYYLDDEIIFFFLKTFKKNTKIFDFLNPIFIQSNDFEPYVSSNCFENSIFKI